MCKQGKISGKKSGTNGGTMVLRAYTTIGGDSKGRKLRIYIPSMLALDSAFPFKKGDKVIIEIDNKNQSLVIKRIEKYDK